MKIRKLIVPSGMFVKYAKHPRVECYICFLDVYREMYMHDSESTRNTTGWPRIREYEFLEKSLHVLATKCGYVFENFHL